ncbi:hypothetical protein TRVL_05581 [Trypanosoma vivax]|nr:hypothetical protein TRVL_05581 [Trypanosoma vivax]
MKPASEPIAYSLAASFHVVTVVWVFFYDFIYGQDAHANTTRPVPTCRGSSFPTARLTHGSAWVQVGAYCIFSAALNPCPRRPPCVTHGRCATIGVSELVTAQVALCLNKGYSVKSLYCKCHGWQIVRRYEVSDEQETFNSGKKAKSPGTMATQSLTMFQHL